MSRRRDARPLERLPAPRAARCRRAPRPSRGEAPLADARARRRSTRRRCRRARASSSFVTTRSGTCAPSPVIETRCAVRRADHCGRRREGQRAAHGELVADARDRLAAADRPAHRLELAGERQLVARLDDPLEAHVVDPGEERELAAVLLERQRRDRAGLRERLDHDHARHDRPAGEVPGEEPLVAAHRLRATTRTPGSSSSTSSRKRNGSRCGMIDSITSRPNGACGGMCAGESSGPIQRTTDRSAWRCVSA